MKMDQSQRWQEPLEEGVLPLPPREEGDDWEPDVEFLADSAASQLSIARSTGRGYGSTLPEARNAASSPTQQRKTRKK